MTPEKFTYYKIGIPEVDDEHWSMFVLVHEASTYVRDGNNTAAYDALRRLYEHLVAHFSSEIEIMAALNFPFISTHATEHGLLLCAMQRVLDDAAKGIYTDLDAKLTHIFIDHIEHYDVLYAQRAKVFNQ